jgi:hypothetical protein
MITIFTLPKAFDGHINIIQRNAIKSWTCLSPKCQIVICGNDPGTEEVAKEFDVKCIPDIERNEFGTPLLSSAFEKVKTVAVNNLLCYVNSDIIFLSDFILSINRVKTDTFLLIGNRCNVDIKESIDFETKDWELKLIRRIEQTGSLQSPIGADYFVFRKDEALAEIPPFAVGRPGWDNWFIYNARKRKYRVIDASKVVTAVHQNHDYSHLSAEHSKRPGEIHWDGWEGPEIEKQRKLLEAHGQIDNQQLFRLLDATHILTERKLRAAVDYQHLRRAFDTLPVFYPRFRAIVDFINENVVGNLRRYR